MLYLLTVGIDRVHIDAICNSFWMELAKPYLQGENTNEGKLFWEALMNNDPALAQECKDCLTISNADARASATSKQKLLKDSTSFFVQDMQKNFLIPIAIMMNLLPASFDSDQLHEAGYLESLRITER